MSVNQTVLLTTQTSGPQRSYNCILWFLSGLKLDFFIEQFRSCYFQPPNDLYFLKLFHGNLSANIFFLNVKVSKSVILKAGGWCTQRVIKWLLSLFSVEIDIRELALSQHEMLPAHLITVLILSRYGISGNVTFRAHFSLIFFLIEDSCFSFILAEKSN